MTEPSGYVLETLWEDVELVLSRGVREGEGSPLLVVAPVATQPSPGSLTRLEHAYALRDELDPAWAARPLRLVRHRGRPMLLRSPAIHAWANGTLPSLPERTNSAAL